MRTAAGVALILAGATFLASFAAYLVWSHFMFRVGLGAPILALLAAEAAASAACVATGLALLLRRSGPRTRVLSA